MKAKKLHQVQIENSQYNASVSYVPTTEVTKYVRSLLAIKFPGVKFSVRKSDGSAVNVSWELGSIRDVPAQLHTAEERQEIRNYETEAVRTLIGGLHGEGFDGMVDMRYPRKHYLLPNGELQYGGCDAGGTTYTSETLPLPAGAREVHLSNSFIFCQPAY